MYYEKFMQRALSLARQGHPLPNPYVGAVLVYDEEIIGEGFHDAFGSAHAEIIALADAKKKYSVDIIQKSTMYITFEPCDHQGKTPPCVSALIDAGIKEVYVGMLDPHPIVAGKGLAHLRSYGIIVHVGFLEAEIKQRNALYLQFLQSSRSFVILKNAVSLNGKITNTKEYKKYISGKEALYAVHQLRGFVDVVLVGVNTVLADDPLLTTHGVEKKEPMCVVLDYNLRCPADARVLLDKHCIICCGNNYGSENYQKLKDKVKEIIICPEKNGKLDLLFVLTELRKRGINVVLVEGGKQLNTSLFQQNLVDKLILIVAPVVLDETELDVVDKNAVDLEQVALRYHFVHSEHLGKDLWLEFVHYR